MPRSVSIKAAAAGNFGQIGLWLVPVFVLSITGAAAAFVVAAVRSRDLTGYVLPVLYVATGCVIVFTSTRKLAGQATSGSST